MDVTSFFFQSLCMLWWKAVQIVRSRYSYIFHLHTVVNFLTYFFSLVHMVLLCFWNVCLCNWWFTNIHVNHHCVCIFYVDGSNCLCVVFSSGFLLYFIYICCQYSPILFVSTIPQYRTHFILLRVYDTDLFLHIFNTAMYRMVFCVQMYMYYNVCCVY